VGGGAWTGSVLVRRVRVVGLAAVLGIASLGATGPTVLASAPTAQATRTTGDPVLRYFPLTSAGQNIDDTIGPGVNDRLGVIQAKVNRMTTNVAAAMSEGTKYRGYDHPCATADLAFSIVTKEFRCSITAP
jgi:hypothetical protein